VDVEIEVKRIIASQLKIPFERLLGDVRLKDLGAESLDFVEVLFELEEKFDISLPFNANQPMQKTGGDLGDESILLTSTIDELSGLIERLVAEKASEQTPAKKNQS
jgi:acyl carrier protein